ncbi:MAG: hypothetical protein A2Y15_08355 [Clostridiales bacterium GWF2_36_10]|nr:MAG: hypothetical protein A2Y15_08355 [Clostridiales bacterium GWF2_36_10]HAN20313.1 hypothetical protein [Clostridiales bacterium]
MKGIKDFYNKTANEWSEKWYRDESMLPYLIKFFKHLPSKPKVLDLCCGAGYESMRMQKLGADVTGIDFSEVSIHIAKEHNPQIKFVVDNILNDYTYLGKFDGCTVIAGFIHLSSEQLELAFDRIYNILSDKGYLFIVIRNGSGKSKSSSYVTIDGVEYDRDFYLHTLDELKEHSQGKFEFITELFPDKNSCWKYYIFKYIKSNA